MPMYHYHKSSADPKVSNEMRVSKECYSDARDKYEAGDFEAAYQLLKKAVQMQEILLGKYHADTVTSYWWLGKAACRTHSEPPQEALKAFQRATRTGEVALGKERYSEMLRDMEETLALQGWSNSLNKATSSPNLLVGEHNNNNNQNNSSSRSLRFSLNSSPTLSFHKGSSSRRSLRASFGRSSPVTQKKKLMGVLRDIIAHEQEGDRYFKEGRYGKANEYYGKALTLQDQTMGTDSLDGADIRCKLAYSMLLLHKKSTTTTTKVQQTLQQAYECYVDKVGKDHPATYGVVAKINTIVAPMG
ncbi:MAG: hypothetical protein SGBAC_012654 [Bacillariaceae sp.]